MPHRLSFALTFFPHLSFVAIMPVPVCRLSGTHVGSCQDPSSCQESPKQVLGFCTKHVKLVVPSSLSHIKPLPLPQTSNSSVSQFKLEPLDLPCPRLSLHRKLKAPRSRWLKLQFLEPWGSPSRFLLACRNLLQISTMPT